mmetsp:Transcript_7480/g.11820  ORF Transcript_7480/g.11820 Transcript_7480/m.11820 type:complete len:626 (+) Transcript_7480:79-1956(+)
MEEVSLEVPKDPSSTNAAKVLQTMKFKPGPAGFVVAANDIASNVKSVLMSCERIHKALGTVYSGEREHNKKILNSLKKLRIQTATKTAKSEASAGGGGVKKEHKKEGHASAASSSSSSSTEGKSPTEPRGDNGEQGFILDPLAKASQVSEDILRKQAVRRVRIASDMLEQVVHPLGQVAKDAKAKYTLLFNKHRGAGHEIFELGDDVKRMKRESIEMLRACKEARRREIEKRNQPQSHEEGRFSSLFQAISTGVSEMVRGKFDEILKDTESKLLLYQQSISKANRRQEKFIRRDLPVFLKHYSSLTVSVSKMTKKAILSGLKFQNKDLSLKGLLSHLEMYAKSINPDTGVPMLINACLAEYIDTIKTFECSRWKYELPIHPLQVKPRFGLANMRRKKAQQDFVVVDANRIKSPASKKKKQQQQQQQRVRGGRKNTTGSNNNNPPRRAKGAPASRKQRQAADPNRGQAKTGPSRAGVDLKSSPVKKSALPPPPEAAVLVEEEVDEGEEQEGTSSSAKEGPVIDTAMLSTVATFDLPETNTGAEDSPSLAVEVSSADDVKKSALLSDLLGNDGEDDDDDLNLQQEMASAIEEGVPSLESPSATIQPEGGLDDDDDDGDDDDNNDGGE